MADQVGVRIRFGVGDTQVADWDGSVELSEGKVLSIDGWRFQNPDKVVGTNSWTAKTRKGTARRTNNPGRAQANNNANNAPVFDNGVLLALDGVTPKTKVSVNTVQGKFEFTVSELSLGTVLERLEKQIGRAHV